MKKNNKGFFLAETIVIIALVTTVMAFVYPNVSKLYENYQLQVKYYDQPEDIYALRAIYSNNASIKGYTTADCEYNDSITPNVVGAKVFESTLEEIISYEKNYTIDLSHLYITGYMSDVSDNNDYNFNRYLKRMKKTTNDKPAYRLIGVFEVTEGSETITRYASIKIENPNPNRNCNL